MSVLYKALQKAEKENELRQSASSGSNFDPQRLAASGALKSTGGRSLLLNRIAMAAIGVIAVGGGVAFLVLKDSLMQAPGQVASSLPPVPAPQPPPQATTPATSEQVVAAPVPSQAPAPYQGDLASATVPPPATEATVASAETAAATVPAAPSAQTEPVVAEGPAPEAPAPKAPVPAETKIAGAARAPAKPAQAERSQPMPTIPANSPARMLSPPVSINRAEFALAGVGDQVQVRDVSQNARNQVAAGYDALVGGMYEAALISYDRALTEEPNSILALLGRGAALQKLGRPQEAQASYDQVLKLDPQNREALTNVTAILGDRAPQEALNRLLELEREYTAFSPIKAQIGLAYAKIGSMQEALEYFRKALAISPDVPLYHYNMALVLDHMGLRDQAIAGYETVLASISAGRGSTDLSPADIQRRVRFLKAR